MPLPDIDHIKFSQLPDELRSIELEVSRSVAIKLAAPRGGSRISFPGWGRLKNDSHLVVDFGLETVVGIIKALGGQENSGVTLNVPLAKEELMFCGVYRYFTMGFSPDEISLEVGCHRTQVYRVLKLLKGAGIIPADLAEFLSDDQKCWLDALYSTGRGPIAQHDISSIARSLSVPRIAVQTFIEKYKTQGKS